MDGAQPAPSFMEVFSVAISVKLPVFLWAVRPHQAYNSAHWVCKWFLCPWILYIELVICDGSLLMLVQPCSGMIGHLSQ